MTLAAIAILIPTIIGLVGVFTQVGMSKRFAPLMCLILGIALTFLYTQSLTLGATYVGILTGLAATGTYAGAKKTVSKAQPEPVE